jgi:hypothetical protein
MKGCAAFSWQSTDAIAETEIVPTNMALCIFSDSAQDSR